MSDSLVIQKPSGKSAQLILLFHGVGGEPQDLAPLAQRLAGEFPQAAVVCVAGPVDCDLGRGYQWFSIQGISDTNRPERVAAAMPMFERQVRQWQQMSGVSVDATALIGFSQGGIMALESSGLADRLSGRVLSIAGRFARLPETAPPLITFHLFHGKADSVVHYSNTVIAAEALVRLGADITADVIPFLAHEIDEEVTSLIVERLKGYVPKRIWDEAMKADSERPGQ
jgi:phospholipase/carboxylesterase